jgi:holo-[acyl-carrier protein] synthase
MLIGAGSSRGASSATQCRLICSKPSTMAGSLAPSSNNGPLVVGTDIVDVADVEGAMRTFGDRYLNRVFTEAELGYCLAVGRTPAPHLAARFAAKEAALKVLRPTKDDAISLKSIEAVRTEGGWCELSLSGAALALANRAGLVGFSMSLSHEARYATAVVVAHRDLTREEKPRTARKRKARGGRDRL